MKPPLALAFDLAFVLIATLIVGPPLAAVAALVGWLALPAWAAWGLAPVWFVLFLVGLALMLGAFRLCLPRLTPGHHPFPNSPQAVAWLLHFSLQRIANQPLWRPMIWSLAGLRWLTLRALGAKAAFGIQSAMDVMLVDPSSFAVGPGSMLAAGTLVTGHMIEHDRILIGPVKLGAGVQIMGQVALGPGVELADGVVVGPGSKLLPNVKVGEDAFIGLGCLLYDNVVVGANAVIGHQVVVDRGAVIGEGAVIRPFTHVPRGLAVPEGAKYPPALQEPRP